MTGNPAHVLEFDVGTITSRSPVASPSSMANFINRDLSLIEFFRRVLEEAQDHRHPLLERLKFISILSSNLDEFFVIRVSGLKEKLDTEVGVSADGYSTPELLEEIRGRVSELLEIQSLCLSEEIMPALEREGISIVAVDSLAPETRDELDRYFNSSIYPLLTPQAVDPTHPFPYISGGSINVGMFASPKLHKRTRKARDGRGIGDDFFVRLKIPPFIPRLVTVPGTESQFVLAENLVIANIAQLVPEAVPQDCHIFRITRDADIDLREAETEDLLEAMTQNLKLRRFGEVSRLEVSGEMPDEMVEYLRESLEIVPADIYRIAGIFNPGDLSALYKINRPELKDAPLKVSNMVEFESGESTFDLIKRGDILLHHPYMPYSIVTDFIREAANDPDVLAIKMCLYRIGAESPIAPLLIEASESGKQVTVLIEIKARFDEENNIEWARRLEESGVHVVYGILGLKTHCKTTLVIRREGEDLRRYVHIATGNYNQETSAFYTDLGLLTASDAIGADATELFNYLTVYSRPESFNELVVAPIYLRKQMLKLIKGETANAEVGKPARIIAKMNRLADAEIVNALYDASRAGVEIDLIIRGVCTLRPGVPGLSENIRVRSIVGRLLEHSRVYYFENGGDSKIYTGSSDWMPRNLDRRVEVLTPVYSPPLRSYLRHEFLESYLRDTAKARELRPDGTYTRPNREHDTEVFDSQMSFQLAVNVIHIGNSH